jgi:hypothetical protein
MLRAQRFVCLLWTLSCCTAAQGDPTTLLRYDYEHLARVGGLYTPALIRWNIDQIERMIRDEMPRFAATYQPPPPVEPQVEAETLQ